MRYLHLATICRKGPTSAQVILILTKLFALSAVMKTYRSIVSDENISLELKSWETLMEILLTIMGDYLDINKTVMATSPLARSFVRTIMDTVFGVWLRSANLKIQLWARLAQVIESSRHSVYFIHSWAVNNY